MNWVNRCLIGLVASLLFLSCNEQDGLNVFSIEDELLFGERIDQLIYANPVQYPIIDEVDNPEPYTYIRNQILKNIISDTGSVKLDSVFNYADKLRIIDNPAISAFTSPGGHIYVYNGLIQFMQYEDQLAGILSLELAHAERRHITQNVVRASGLSIDQIRDYVRDSVPDPAIATQIITAFGSMVFSKVDEFEADIFALQYLRDSKYSCTGHARGLEEMLNAVTENFTPAYLFSHRTDSTRISTIDSLATKNPVYLCNEIPLAPTSYVVLQNLLN